MVIQLSTSGTVDSDTWYFRLLFKKNDFWAVSGKKTARIRAYNKLSETEQLLGLFKYIFQDLESLQ